MILSFHSKLTNLIILLLIIFIVWNAYFARKAVHEDADVEIRINEIRNKEIVSKEASNTDETKGFIYEFLNKNFKDQMEYFIQLQNIKK